MTDENVTEPFAARDSYPFAAHGYRKVKGLAEGLLDNKVIYGTNQLIFLKIPPPLLKIAP